MSVPGRCGLRVRRHKIRGATLRQELTNSSLAINPPLTRFAVVVEAVTVPPKNAVVEDDRDLSNLLRRVLEQEGFEFVGTHDGFGAQDSCQREQPDLIVLDVMLPGVDGSSICRQLRQDPNVRDTPVLFLTARSEEADRVRGLENGGDDYVVKPFSVRELVARVKLRLRGRAGLEPVYRLGGLELDHKRREVRLDGRRVAVTATEFQLLAASFCFKNFDKPIEQTMISAVALLRTFSNANAARNYGFEFEFRRGLNFLTPKLREFAVSSNFTFVDSNIDLEDIDRDIVLTSLNRAMQGQSQYVTSLITEWGAAQSPQHRPFLLELFLEPDYGCRRLRAAGCRPGRIGDDGRRLRIHTKRRRPLEAALRGGKHQQRPLEAGPGWRDIPQLSGRADHQRGHELPSLLRPATGSRRATGRLWSGAAVRAFRPDGPKRSDRLQFLHGL